jgi:hypothetical protein
VLRALHFTSSHHTPSLQNTLSFGDHRALTFDMVPVVVVNDDPIPRATQLVCTTSVGVERREMPRAMLRMQDRQPRFG